MFVDFFFLLSGFVLTLSAEPRMANGWGTLDFLRARIVRLWPMTAVGVVLGALALFSVGWPQDIVGFLVLGLLMIPAIFNREQIFPLNGPQWSLFLELIANLAHGLVLRRLDNRGLLTVVALSGAAFVYTTLYWQSNSVGPFAANWWWALPRLFFSYTLGVWFGRQWKPGGRTAILSWDFALALPPLCVLALTAVPLTVAHGDILVVMGLFPALFWAAAHVAPPPTAAKGLQRLGAISFPLYAVHMPVLMVFTPLGRSQSAMLTAILGALLAACLLAGTMGRIGRLGGMARDRVTGGPKAGAV